MPPVFRYATLEAVKSRIDPDIISASGITDPQILTEIENASAAINDWTRQYFQPVPEIARINGRGDPVIQNPGGLPALLLKQVALVADRSTGEYREMDRIIPGMRNWPESMRGNFRRTQDGSVFLLTADGGQIAWEPGQRTITMISLRGGFTKGYKNIELTGWWGWLEGYKIVQVALTTALPANTLTTTSLVVDAVQDPTTGDFLEVGDTVAVSAQEGVDDLVPKRAELAIIRAIAGVGPFTLTVDALHPYPFIIPIGAKVRAFGRVPAGLRQVAEFLAARFVHKRIAEVTGDTDALLSLAMVDGTLQSEKTDNYSYTLRSAGGDGSAGGGSKRGMFTGSAQMDLLLKMYAQPGIFIRYI